jgi:hypothetical protein
MPKPFLFKWRVPHVSNDTIDSDALVLHKDTILIVVSGLLEVMIHSA